MGLGPAVRVANPLRRGAVPPHEPAPRLLEAASRNRQREVDPVALFEVGHVFRVGDPVDEREHVAWSSSARAPTASPRRTGRSTCSTRRASSRSCSAGSGSTGARAGAERPFHAGRSGSVLVDGRPSAWWARSTRRSPPGRSRRPRRRRRARRDRPADPGRGTGRLPRRAPVPAGAPRPRVVVTEEIPVGTSTPRSGAAGSLLGRSRLFDVFRGGSIPEGRKSLAFALEFRALDRTLTDQEIEPLIAAIVERLERDLDATLRT